MSKNINNVELNLLTDSAISNIEHDSLDFNVYSEVITEAILETPTPFTVGIFGEWGRGKTSLMKFIQKEVTEKKILKGSEADVKAKLESLENTTVKTNGDKTEVTLHKEESHK